MFLFLAKLITRLTRPTLIVVLGQYRLPAAAALIPIFQRKKKRVAVVNSAHAHWEKKVFFAGLFFPRAICVIARAQKFEVLKIKNLASSRIIVAHTGVSDIPAGIEVFASERETVAPFAAEIKALGSRDALILFGDDTTMRYLKEKSEAPAKTFGWNEDDDVYISNPSLLAEDRFLAHEKGSLAILNAKLNTRKQSVPVRMKNVAGRAHLYGAAAAAACFLAFDETSNVLEIAQALEGYVPPEGFLRVLKGRKNTIILDDSFDATLFSMLEAIEILEHFKEKKRVAVLGEILTGEAEGAMRSVAAQAIKHCEVLVAVGTEAKVMAEEARARGFAEENIYAFADVKEALRCLGDIIKGGEVILVDGAKERGMGRIARSLV